MNTSAASFKSLDIVSGKRVIQLLEELIEHCPWLESFHRPHIALVKEGLRSERERFRERTT